MNADFIKMHDDASCFSIMDAIDKNDIRSVPMIDSGGKLLGDNPVSVGAGETHALFDAQKDGYDFVGWNTRQASPIISTGFERLKLWS